MSKIDTPHPIPRCGVCMAAAATIASVNFSYKVKFMTELPSWLHKGLPSNRLPMNKTILPVLQGQEERQSISFS